jgi:MFS transporter, putative metabolite:H+ symporter
MPDNKPDDLLDRLDAAPLTARYWISMALLVLHEMFDYFDFFVVGYLVAVLAPQWHLTYGQSTMILLGAGLGAIFGALILGKLSDIVGRKPVVIGGAVLIAISAGSIAFIPDDSWLMFSLLRIVVGAGLGGAMSAQTALIVELTPTRLRTFIGSVTVAPVSLGILLAALLSSQLLALIGWRGLAAIGFFPILIAVALLFILPESPRWLLSRGRFADARKAAALQMGVLPETLPLPVARWEAARPAPLRALLRNRRAFWLIVLTWLGMSATTYGYQLWGPTILAMALNLPVKNVAIYFTVVGVAGFAGRFLFSALPLWIGRRHSGEIMGWGAAVFILAAGLWHREMIDGFPVFIVCLTAAAVFVNGGFANMAPFAAESYPVELAGRAVGLAQAVNGVGKIIGPLMLGLIAGVGNIVEPKATESAVVPAFIFLSCCSLVAALAYRLLPIETHGKRLTLNQEISHDQTVAAQPATLNVAK